MEHFGLFSTQCQIEPFSTKNTGLPTGNDIDYEQYFVFKYYTGYIYHEILLVVLLRLLQEGQ